MARNRTEILELFMISPPDPIGMSEWTNTEAEADPDTGTYEREVLAEDLRTILEHIESIHADPYHGYDGRVDLHHTVETAIRDLPQTTTREAFYRHAAPILAGLDDAHSRLVPPERSGESGRLPLSFRVVGDSLYVDAVHEASLTDVVGGRVTSFEGRSIDELAERGASLRGAENQYWALRHLARSLGEYDAVDRLLETTQPPRSPTIAVEGTDGADYRWSVAPVPTDREPVAELETTVEAPSGTGPRYRLYEGGDAAVFVPGDLTGYREAVEAACARDRTGAERIARDIYRRHVGNDPPEELTEVIAALPPMTETMTNLVRAMSAATTEALIIDLRDNPGGDSRFVQQLCYFLYGINEIVETANWGVAVKRRTDAHRAEYGVPDGIRDGYATFEHNPADYDFGTAFRRAAADREAAIAQFEGRLGAGTFGEELDARTHERYYAPEQVVVVTSEATMSSAFAGAALLSEFGAEIVGVPSGQAPVSFGEAVGTVLPNTELTVELSGAMFRWVPDPGGSVLSVDRELTPELFESRYDRAGDAGLRLAFDHVGVTHPGQRPTPE